MQRTAGLLVVKSWDDSSEREDSVDATWQSVELDLRDQEDSLVLHVCQLVDDEHRHGADELHQYAGEHPIRRSAASASAVTDAPTGVRAPRHDVNGRSPTVHEATAARTATSSSSGPSSGASPSRSIRKAKLSLSILSPNVELTGASCACFHVLPGAERAPEHDEPQCMLQVDPLERRSVLVVSRGQRPSRVFDCQSSGLSEGLTSMQDGARTDPGACDPPCYFNCH